MSGMHAVSGRLRDANDLPTILDAAYNAFEEMLAVIRAHEDPAGGMFTALVMAAGSAADGRGAILLSPSLPPHRLHLTMAGAQDQAVSTEGAVEALAGLSRLLVIRLADAASLAVNPADRTACMDAAWWAQDVHALLLGGGP